MDNRQCIGSPPRMRGKRICFSVRAQQTGITPADAGKTALMPDGGAVKWDHPRGCGENAFRGHTAQSGTGSPPRMRGKQSKHFKRARDGRITPADAGKTELAMEDGKKGEDHPRGCGENVCNSFADTSIVGSPPRMRGKHCKICPFGEGSRITPADAGKTERTCPIAQPR